MNGSRRSGLVGSVGTFVFEAPAVLLTLVMMFHVTGNALMRTILNDPIPNTLEYVRYWYMPVIAMLGFVAAQMRGQHIAADLIFQWFPKAVQRHVLALVFVVCAAVCVMVAYYSWTEAIGAFEIRKHAGITDIPAWPVYFLIPMMFAVMAVQLGWAALEALRSESIEDIEEQLLSEVREPEKGIL